MKNFFYIVISVLLSIHGKAQSSCANSINIYSFTANGSNYEIIKEAKTWTAAATCAVQRGGYLVQINSQAEQTAVYNGIISSSIASNYSPVGDGGGASYLWTGATDKNAEGTWLWDGNNDNLGTNFWTGQGQAGTGTGSVVGGSYVNWGGKSTSTIQEPDDFNSNQDAAAIALSSWPFGIAGEWNDIAMTNSIYYIVEYASTGIQDINLSENVFSVYPNPALNKITLSLTTDVKLIELWSTEGKLIKILPGIIGTQTININELNSGMYFISITTKDNHMITKKIVIE